MNTVPKNIGTFKVEADCIGWLDLCEDISFESALNNLFNYLRSEDGEWCMKEYPKQKFNISLLVGVDKYGDNTYQKFTSFTTNKLKKII